MFHDENPSTGKLSDEELDQVIGGYGEWNRDKENTCKKQYEYVTFRMWTNLPFDEWLLSTGHTQDEVDARGAWINAGKPPYKGFCCENGATWDYFIYL